MFNLGLEGGVEVYQRHNEELAGGGVVDPDQNDQTETGRTMMS